MIFATLFTSPRATNTNAKTQVIRVPLKGSFVSPFPLATKLLNLSDGKDLSADCLTREAISSGIFIKPGTDSKESYSQSWVLGRLRQNDKKVAKKLVEFAAAI